MEENRLSRGPDHMTDQAIMVGDFHLKRIKNDILLRPEERIVTTKPAPTLKDALSVLENFKGRGSCIVIHTGTNDLKSKDEKVIVDLTGKCINEAVKKAEKVVISTIIPPYDELELNTKAQMVDAFITQAFSNKESIIISDNCNLNTRMDNAGKFFILDRLHLNEQGTKIFASNLKTSVCNALGIGPKRQEMGYRKGGYRGKNFDNSYNRSHKGYYGNYRRDYHREYYGNYGRDYQENFNGRCNEDY